MPTRLDSFKGKASTASDDKAASPRAVSETGLSPDMIFLHFSKTSRPVLMSGQVGYMTV